MQTGSSFRKQLWGGGIPVNNIAIFLFKPTSYLNGPLKRAPPPILVLDSSLQLVPEAAHSFDFCLQGSGLGCLFFLLSLVVQGEDVFGDICGRVLKHMVIQHLLLVSSTTDISWHYLIAPHLRSINQFGASVLDAAGKHSLIIRR